MREPSRTPTYRRSRSRQPVLPATPRSRGAGRRTAANPPDHELLQHFTVFGRRGRRRAFLV